jgi:TPR repeat protein
MSRFYTIILSVLITTPLFAAQVAKTQEEKITFVSTDQKAFQISTVWVEESRWVIRSILDAKRESGKIEFPIPMRSLVRIDGLLELYKAGNHDKITAKLKKFVGLDSQKPLSFSTLQHKLLRLDELYQKILMLEIDCLVPFIEETLCALMQYKTFVNSFLEDRAFFDETQLSKDLAQEPAPFNTHTDLQYLQARLCTECKVDYAPTCIDVDPTGEYLVVCGKQSSSKYLLEVLDIRTGKSMSRLQLGYAPRGVQFCKGRKIVVWGDHTIDLYGTFPLTKCTPQEWEKKAKTSKRIWAVGISAQGTLAIGIDDKIFFTSPTNTSLQHFTDIVSKNEKARSKKGRTSLFFVDNGKILVELYKDGELYFYRCENKVRIGQDTDLPDIAHYYPNGSKLITISSRREARIWNCQTGLVEQKGTMKEDKRTFIPYRKLHEMDNESTSVFCDTTQSDFPEKFVQGSMLGNTVEVGPDRIPRMVPTEGNCVTTEPRYKPNAFYVSQHGSVCVGINKDGHITIWHYYDKALNELLTTRLTLTQGFCVHQIIEGLRSGESVQTFLRKPHMSVLFESLAQELQTHIIRSFSSVSRALAIPGREQASSPELPAVASASSSSSSSQQRTVKRSDDNLQRTSSTPINNLSTSARLPITHTSPASEGLIRAQSDSDRRVKRSQDDDMLSLQTLSQSSSTAEPELGSFKRGLALYRNGSYKEAYERFQEAALEQESPYRISATFLLGEMLLRGNGISYNPAEAATQYERVIKTDDNQLKAYALLRLGEIYYYGLGSITRSQARSIDYFTRILNLETQVTGCKIAAHLYLLRIDRRELQQDSTSHYTPAIKIFEEAKVRDPLTLLYMGRLHLEHPSDGNHKEAAATYFLEAAQGKDTYLRIEAWYRLAKLYFDQQLTSVAEKYLLKTLEQDCNNWVKPMSEVYLGQLCMKSNGVGEQRRALEALNYFTRAKKQLDNNHARAEACYWIARLYEGDYEGIEKDASLVYVHDTEAVALAENNHDKQLKAHLSLGQQFHTGTGTVTMNRKRAKDHLKKVIDESHDAKILEEACFRLAELNNLFGTADDEESATNLYLNILNTGSKKDYVRRAQEVLAEKLIEQLNLAECSEDDDLEEDNDSYS